LGLFPAKRKRRKAMTCIRCHHQTCKRFGYFGKRRIQRWRCNSCKSTFCEPHTKLTRDTMLANPDAAARAIQCLVEGCSIRSTERLTGLNRNTIMRLLILAGAHSARLMDERMHELHSRYLQVDEIWTFVQKKARRIRSSDSPEIGDQWIFVAIDAETKLIPSFRIGKRSRQDTTEFLWDLYRRLADRVQLTTDGLIHYTRMVPECFGLDVDFAQVVKLFGEWGQSDANARYSPSPIVEVISKVRSGDPDPDHISTSYVERQNLTMRMQLRRLTRLTNAFSKKLSHLKAAVALHFAYYNFCRVHSSLRITPAMEAGLTDHVWASAELLGV
jgi:transposase-like protein/IS1 family transposase